LAYWAPCALLGLLGPMGSLGPLGPLGRGPPGALLALWAQAGPGPGPHAGPPAPHFLWATWVAKHFSLDICQKIGKGQNKTKLKNMWENMKTYAPLTPAGSWAG